MVNERGYGSFFVATFNFWKSTQIQNWPLILGTIIIDDSQEASSTSWINPMYNQKFVNMLFDSSNIIGILIDTVLDELTILRYQVQYDVVQFYEECLSDLYRSRQKILELLQKICAFIRCWEPCTDINKLRST